MSQLNSFDRVSCYKFVAFSSSRWLSHFFYSTSCHSRTLRFPRIKDYSDASMARCDKGIVTKKHIVMWTMVGHKTIHINLLFTRSRKPKGGNCRSRNRTHKFCTEVCVICRSRRLRQTRGFDNSWYHAKTEFNNCFIRFSYNSSSETEAKRSAILFLRRTLHAA